MAPLAETSITAMATRMDDIEQAEPLPSEGEFVLGRGFDRQDYAALFAPRAVSATLRNYRLTDVHLDTAAMTLIKDGCKIKETNYLVPPDYYDRACILDQGLIRLDAGTDYIMARAFDNYYHWMIQSIPALDWSLRTLPTGHFSLLAGHLNQWQAEMLAILGHERVPRVALDPNHHYAIPTLNYSAFQNGSTSFEVSRSAQATFNRMAAAAITSSPAEADILYVARSDTSNRVAANEAAVIKHLTAEGIAIVVPGQMSVSQQINLFAKADAVIGPHGAGLTNIVFCRPGTVFYELSPVHYLNPCFTRLAQSARLTYTIDLFESEPVVSSDPHARGWMIDPDLVLERVRTIKQRIVSLRPRPVFMPGRMSAMDYLKSAAANPGPAPVPATVSEARAKPEAKAKSSHSRFWLSRLLPGRVPVESDRPGGEAPGATGAANES